MFISKDSPNTAKEANIPTHFSMEHAHKLLFLTNLDHYHKRGGLLPFYSRTVTVIIISSSLSHVLHNCVSWRLHGCSIDGLRLTSLSI